VLDGLARLRSLEHLHPDLLIDQFALVEGETFAAVELARFLCESTINLVTTKEQKAKYYVNMREIAIALTGHMAVAFRTTVLTTIDEHFSEILK
jgi:hypothetical protein